MSDITTEIPQPEDRIDSQPWEAFKAQNKLQPRYDWHHAKVPAELQIAPDDSKLPEKLKQIVAWSLIQLPPPSPTHTRHKADEDVNPSSTTQHDEGPDTIDGQHPLLEPTITKLPTDSLSLLPPRTAKGPGSQQRRLHTNPNSLGQGLFTSTLDLIITFDPKTERDDTTPNSAKKGAQVECTSCFDEFPADDTPVLPCSHPYCKDCLKELVLTALRNESSFPPKCCLTEIPLQTILLPLNKKQRETYKDKAAEYAVPADQRWYCPNTKCLKWIPRRKASRFLSSSLRCTHCHTKLCGTCRGMAHRRSQDCPQDYGLEATLSLAEAEGWRRCFSCRALVERTEGCRHMACRCGSQFCYYCGKKWRTCKCTDMLGITQIAQRRHQTELEAAIAALEADEIARAIAEVEALERREEEERLREVERLQRERFREEERLKVERLKEEERLRQLEQLRLQEEEQKKVEKEREEKEYRRVLRLSIDEQLELLWTAFRALQQSQQQALDNRHLVAEQAHSKAHEDAITRQCKKNADLIKMMETNIERRTSSIGDKRQSDLTAFEKESEQAEDDIFLQIQLHLQGKPNKEVREQRLRDELTQQRAQKLETINRRFESEIAALKQNATMELNILERTAENRLAEIEARYDHELRNLLANVTTDRAWYNCLAERRQNMLARNSLLMLEAVDNDQDVIGLTEDVAMTIGPFAIAEPSPASSVTGSPSNSFVELAEGSQRLLKTLIPDDVPSANGREQSANEVPENQAWDFMTLGTALASPGSIPNWSPGRGQQRSTIDRQAFPITRYSAYRGNLTMSGALSPLDEKHSSSLHHRQSRRPNGAPPVPPIPTIYLPGDAQQSRRRGPASLVPNQQPLPEKEALSPQSSVFPSEHEDHKFIVIPSLHSRQSSSDSSGKMTNSSSSTSMSSFDSGFGISGQQRLDVGGSLNPDPKQSARRLWSFRNLAGKSADKYTEEEIRERMKGTVGDAFGA